MKSNDASLTWVAMSVGEMLVSTSFAMLKQRKDKVNYFGLWAPTMVLMGIHNKFVNVDVPGSLLETKTSIKPNAEGAKIAA